MKDQYSIYKGMPPASLLQRLMTPAENEAVVTPKNDIAIQKSTDKVFTPASSKKKF
jgi:hypothetical protein